MFRLDLLQDQDVQNILLVSRVESKLNRKLCKETDLNASMDKLVNQGMILNVSLRIQGEILLGIVRIYNKKVELFIDDATTVLKNLQKALKQALQSTPDAIDAKDRRDIAATDIFNDEMYLRDLPANWLFGESTTDDEQLEEGPLILDSQTRRQKREFQQELMDWDELPSQEQIEQAERECEQLRRSLAGEGDIDRGEGEQAEGEDDVVRAEARSPGGSLNEGLQGSLNQQQNTSSRSKDQNEEADMNLIPDDPMQIDLEELEQHLPDQDLDQQNMDIEFGGADLIPDVPEQPEDGDINQQQQDDGNQLQEQEEIEQQDQIPPQDLNQGEQQDEPEPERAQVAEQVEQQQEEQVGREYVGRKRRALFDMDTLINRAEQRLLLQNRDSLIRPRQRLMLKHHKNLDDYGDAEYIAEIYSINQNQAPALRNLYERVLNPRLQHQLQRQRQQEQEGEYQQEEPDQNDNQEQDQEQQQQEQDQNVEQAEQNIEEDQENMVGVDLGQQHEEEHFENLDGQQFEEQAEQLNEEFYAMGMEVGGEQQVLDEPVVNGHVEEEEVVQQQPVQEDGSSSMQQQSDSLGVQFSGLGKQAQNGSEEIEQDQLEVDPSTGFTKQTQIVHDNLKNVFTKQAAEGREGSIGIYKLVQGRDKQTAARVFFETLALQNKGYVKLSQQSSDADIILQPTEKLMGLGVDGDEQQENVVNNMQNVMSQEDEAA